MVQTADVIFRDFSTDGISATGPHEPRKAEIREWGTWLEGIFGAIGENGGWVYDTRANLFADLGLPANASAWVVADSTPGYNGIYRKIGAAGTGSYTRVADLPYSFIKATDAGAGTPNAIVATSSLPIPAADGAALIALNIFRENDASPVTVTINGSTFTMKSNSGNDIVAGGLTAGMIVPGYVSGSTFRLITDQVSSAIVAAAEAAQAAAEAARDEALGAVPNVFVTSLAALKALDTTTVTHASLTASGLEGQFIWRTGNYSAQVTSDPLGGIYVKADAIATTAGAWVRTGGWAITGVDVRWFGALSDEVSPSFDSTDAIEAALDLYHRVVFPEGTFLTDGHIVTADSRFISGAGIGKTVLKSTGVINQNVLTGTGDRFRVEDMTIDGSGDTMVDVGSGAGDGAFCIAAYNNQTTEFRRLRIVNAYNKMMVFDGNDDITVEYCVIDGEGSLTQNQDGIQCYGGTSVDCTNVTIRKNLFIGQNRACIYLDHNVKHAVIEENIFENADETLETAVAIVAMAWCDDITIRNNTTRRFKHSVLVRCGIVTIDIHDNAFLEALSAPISFQGQSGVYALISGTPDVNWQERTRTIDAQEYIVLLTKATIRDNLFSFGDVSGNLLEASTSGCVAVVGFIDAGMYSIHDEIDQSGNKLVGASIAIPRYILSAMGANDIFTRWTIENDRLETDDLVERIHTSVISPVRNLSIKRCFFAGLTADSTFDGHVSFTFEENRIESFREGLAGDVFMYVNAQVARVNRNIGNAERCSMSFLMTTPGVVSAPASRYFVKGNELIDDTGSSTNIGIFEGTDHHIPLMDEITRGGSRYYIWMDGDLNLRRSDPNTPPTSYSSGAVT